MINNAGLMPQSLLENLRVEEWERMIDVNIKGVLYGIAAALPYMKQQQSGHFINVSSVAGHTVHLGSAVYSATKYAVRALSEGLRQEVKPYNIRTTVISPGAVATELPNSVVEPATGERIRKFYAAVAIPAASFARAVAFAMGRTAPSRMSRRSSWAVRSMRRSRRPVWPFSGKWPKPRPGSTGWR